MPLVPGNPLNAPGPSGGTANPPVISKTTLVSANYNVVRGSDYALILASSIVASLTITLPTGASEGEEYEIRDPFGVLGNGVNLTLASANVADTIEQCNVPGTYAATSVCVSQATEINLRYRAATNQWYFVQVPLEQAAIVRQVTRVSANYAVKQGRDAIIQITGTFVANNVITLPANPVEGETYEIHDPSARLSNTVTMVVSGNGNNIEDAYLQGVFGATTAVVTPGAYLRYMWTTVASRWQLVSPPLSVPILQRLNDANAAVTLVTGTPQIIVTTGLTATRTIALPTTRGPGSSVTIKDGDGTWLTFPPTVAGAGGDTLESPVTPSTYAASQAMPSTAGASVTYTWDGTRWVIT